MRNWLSPGTTRWLGASLLVAGLSAHPAPASDLLRDDVLAEITRIRAATDPATLRIRLPMSLVDPNDLQWLQQILQEKLPAHDAAHPRILVEIAKTRAYGRNPDGARLELERALDLLEAADSPWRDDAPLRDEAYILWGALELMTSVKEQSRPRAQKVADRISRYLVEEVRNRAPGEIADAPFEKLAGEDAWKALKGFLNLHQAFGAELELTLARAFYQTHGREDTHLVRLASNCAASVVASPRRSYWAYLVYGLYEMGLPLADDHEQGIESLRAGTSLIPDSLSWKRYFVSPDAYFEAKDLGGPRPASREDVARYRCHLLMAEFWLGDPFLDVHGWDTLPGTEIVQKGSPISVETEPARNEADADSTKSLPMKESAFRTDPGGFAHKTRLAVYDWKPTTTTYVFAGPNGEATRSSYEQLGQRSSAGRSHQRVERDRQAEALAWEGEQAIKSQSVSTYPPKAKAQPQVFVAEATFLNPYPERSEGPVKEALTVGIVAPADDKEWDRGRSLRLQLFQGENEVPGVPPLDTRFEYVRTQQLPNGTSMYLEELNTQRLLPGTYRLGIEMDGAAPGQRISYNHDEVVVDDYTARGLMISDFRIRTRGPAGEWLPSALDRVCGKFFSFEVQVYGLRAGSGQHPRYETTYSVFRRADFDEKILPEVERRRAAAEPLALDAFSGLALQPPVAIPQDERTSVAGVGGFDYRGQSRDRGVESLTVDLNVSWLEPGSYVMMLEVSDKAGLPVVRAYRAVPFLKTTVEQLLDPVTGPDAK